MQWVALRYRTLDMRLRNNCSLKSENQIKNSLLFYRESVSLFLHKAYDRVLQKYAQTEQLKETTKALLTGLQMICEVCFLKDSLRFNKTKPHVSEHFFFKVPKKMEFTKEPAQENQ